MGYLPSEQESEKSISSRSSLWFFVQKTIKDCTLLVDSILMSNAVQCPHCGARYEGKDGLARFKKRHLTQKLCKQRRASKEAKRNFNRELAEGTRSVPEDSYRVESGKFVKK